MTIETHILRPEKGIISHEEVEEMLTSTLKGMKYSLFMANLEKSHPRTYSVLTFLGVPDSLPAYQFNFAR